MELHYGDASVVDPDTQAPSRPNNAPTTRLMQVALAVVFMLPCCVATGARNAKSAIPKPAPLIVYGTWNGLRVMNALVQKFETDRQAHFIKYTPIVTEQVVGCLSRHQCDVGVILDSRALEENKKDIAGCRERVPERVPRDAFHKAGLAHRGCQRPRRQ